MISTEALKNKTFCTLVMDLLLFAMSLATGLATVFALHTTFAEQTDLNPTAQKWVTFLCVFSTALGFSYLMLAIDKAGVDVFGDDHKDKKDENA